MKLFISGHVVTTCIELVAANCQQCVLGALHAIKKLQLDEYKQHSDQVFHSSINISLQSDVKITLCKEGKVKRKNLNFVTYRHSVYVPLCFYYSVLQNKM